MKRRSLILILLSAAAVAAILIQNRAPGGRGGEGEQPLVPGLETALNDVTAFTVTQGDDTARLTYSRERKRWEIDQLSHYPADKNRVVEALVALSASDLVEAKTTRKANYDLLGLGAGATRWTVWRGSDVVADLFVGRAAERERQTFIRYPDDPQAWLASGSLSPSARPKDWLETELLDVKNERIATVIVHHPATGDVSFVRTKKGAPFVLTPVPAKPDASLALAARATAEALAHLELTDVLPSERVKAPREDRVTYTTFDGLTVTFRYMDAGEAGADWLSVEAEASDDASAAVKAEAETLDDRTAGWIYQFAPATMNQLALTPADYGAIQSTYRQVD